jgi:hypothetical protein
MLIKGTTKQLLLSLYLFSRNYYNNHSNTSIYKLDDVTVLIFGSLNYDIDRHFSLLSNETSINIIKYHLLLTISSN